MDVDSVMVEESKLKKRLMEEVVVCEKQAYNQSFYFCSALFDQLMQISNVDDYLKQEFIQEYKRSAKGPAASDVFCERILDNIHFVDEMKLDNVDR